VKEIFYTLQGEGANTGRPSVFCRFSGCNLWSGREEDRKSAKCKFCDTDFVGIDGVGGGKFLDCYELSKTIISYWPQVSFQKKYSPMVVFTGGEPLLQLDENLIECMHQADFEVAIETNGTIQPPKGVDWICMSPKKGTDIVINKGQEIKFVYPQDDFDPKEFENLNFQYFFLQPKDDLFKKQNVKLAMEYCLKNPKWRLSLQTQKLLGIR
jgi:7-carboxy-7-deazaguanine synthase (Cx14CxxC type)